MPPEFTFDPKSQNWDKAVKPANTWFRRFSSKAARNPLGAFVQTKWREWVIQRLERTFRQPVKAFRLTEESGRHWGDFISVPDEGGIFGIKGGLGKSSKRLFVPTAVFGEAYERDLIQKMKEHQAELKSIIRHRASASPGTTPGKLARLKYAASTVKSLVDEHEQIEQFLLSLKAQKDAIHALAEEDEAATEAGREKGDVATFATRYDEEGNPIKEAKAAPLPKPDFKHDRKGPADERRFGQAGLAMADGTALTEDKYREIVAKEINGRTLSDHEKELLSKARNAMNRNTLHFKGRHYAMKMDEGTVMGLFQEVVDNHGPTTYLKNLYNWRLYKNTGGMAMPTKGWWQFHFNLGHNAPRWGESDLEWFSRTRSNFSKFISDGEGRSLMREMHIEYTGKRLATMGVFSVSKDVLAAAVQEYGGLDEQTVEERRLAVRDEVSVLELGVRQINAVFNYLIGQSMIGNRFRIPSLSPERKTELINKRDEMLKQLEERKTDPSITVDEDLLGAINESLNTEQDILAKVQWATMDAQNWKKEIQNWTKLFISGAGKLEHAKMKIKDGKISQLLPFGGRIAVVPHNQWPTFTTEGDKVMEYLRQYDPFMNRVVQLGKELDTSAGGLVYQHRQVIKGMMSQYLHDGSVDDGSDIPLKFAIALRLMDPEMMTRFYVNLHEVMGRRRWAGSELDHLRAQVAELSFSIDSVVRKFYASGGSDTEQNIVDRTKMMNRRKDFIKKLILDPEIAGDIGRYNSMLHDAAVEMEKARRTPKAEDADKFREQAFKMEKRARMLKKRIAGDFDRQFGPEIAAAVHNVDISRAADMIAEDGEVKNQVSRRCQNITDWLIGHSEIFGVLIMPHSVAQSSGQGSVALANEYMNEVVNAPILNRIQPTMAG